MLMSSIWTWKKKIWQLGHMTMPDSHTFNVEICKQSLPSHHRPQLPPNFHLSHLRFMMWEPPTPNRAVMGGQGKYPHYLYPTTHSQAIHASPTATSMTTNHDDNDAPSQQHATATSQQPWWVLSTLSRPFPSRLLHSSQAREVRHPRRRRRRRAATSATILPKASTNARLPAPGEPTAKQHLR